MYPEKIYRNKAICHLRYLGWKFGDIQRAFEMKDKRNVVRAWKRDNKKYPIPLEKLADQYPRFYTNENEIQEKKGSCA